MSYFKAILKKARFSSTSWSLDFIRLLPADPLETDLAGSSATERFEGSRLDEATTSPVELAADIAAGDSRRSGAEPR